MLQVAQQLRQHIRRRNSWVISTTPDKGGVEGQEDMARDLAWPSYRPTTEFTFLSQEQGRGEQESSSGDGFSGSPSDPFKHLTTMGGHSFRTRDLGEAGLQLMKTRAGTCEVPEVPLVYRQWHSNVSVLFADICGYTAMTQQVEPDHTMLMLHELFSKYHNLCNVYNVYKVETIGDCYMACCGLLTDDADHAERLVEFGIKMLGVAASVVHPLGNRVRIRVGIHSGRVMSGIVGSTRARYCLFGDTGERCSVSDVDL